MVLDKVKSEASDFKSKALDFKSRALDLHLGQSSQSETSDNGRVVHPISELRDPNSYGPPPKRLVVVDDRPTPAPAFPPISKTRSDSNSIVPPNLPPRRLNGSPPPAAGASSGYLNQGAVSRLASAGISVPDLGITTNSAWPGRPVTHTSASNSPASPPFPSIPLNDTTAVLGSRVVPQAAENRDADTNTARLAKLLANKRKPPPPPESPKSPTSAVDSGLADTNKVAKLDNMPPPVPRASKSGTAFHKVNE